jgi:hypothetical protein
MDDHKATYESQPGRSITQWIKSQPLYDRLEAAYRNTRWSAREIEPFIRKYNIDMSEFEPVKYRSFAEFFDRRFRPGARKFSQFGSTNRIFSGRLTTRVIMIFKIRPRRGAAMARLVGEFGCSRA